MLLLLPPSAGKAAPGRGAPLDLDSLTAAQLTPARVATIDALTRLAVGPAEHARRVLGLSEGQDDQRRANAAVATAPARPALRLYTGVLYEALLEGGLDRASAAWLGRHCLVMSGLFGVLAPGDRVPGYRLPMGTDLPGVGPLARFWRPRLAPVLDARAAAGLVVDLRSAEYAAAWRPPRAARSRWVQVQASRDGRAVTHDVKRTRGLVARHLATTRSRAAVPAQLAEELAAAFRCHLRPSAGGWCLAIEL